MLVPLVVHRSLSVVGHLCVSGSVVAGSSAPANDSSTLSSGRAGSRRCSGCNGARLVSDSFGRMNRSRFGSSGLPPTVGQVDTLSGPCYGGTVYWARVG